MSVLWIIEKVKPDVTTAAHCLMGDYAVRVFASFSSFQKLLKLKAGATPQMVIIDCEDANIGPERMEDLLATYLPHVPRIYLGGEPTGLGGQSLVFWPKPLDGLNFSNFVRQTLTSSRPRTSLEMLRFRDLELDIGRLVCQVVPAGEPLGLSGKEMRLLKLFMEQPGVCLTRDQIKAEVWPDVLVSMRTIDSHISRLRRRLEAAEATIESVYGGGYILR